MREVARAGLHETLEPRIMQVLVALIRHTVGSFPGTN